jgi:hypothetical protein
VRYSVLLSLHERDAIDLQKTFKQLAKASSGREADVEFVICCDFAENDKDRATEVALAEIFRDSVKCPVEILYYDTVGRHPETFHLGTHCNPVAVNNILMNTARGDNLVWVSSDMIVSPLLFDRLDLHLDRETGLLDTVWCARVIDQDSMAEFCGPSRPFPMMWCVAHAATGERHDLELLKGFGFDDNDWMARMGLKTGSITIDLVCIAIHQTHGKVTQVGQLASGKAYSAESAPGWEASTAYMTEKWGGVPFDGKTLEVGYGEVGEFLVLNINGLQNPPKPKAKPKRKRKSRAKKVAKQ